MGFGRFLTLPVVQADNALSMALAERWSPITWTFHLPVGEIGVPLINLFMMTGLSMNGTPPPCSKDFDANLVARCIGPHPMAYFKGNKGVLPSWFETDYIWATNASMPAKKAFSTRAFLLYMLTRLIFYEKSDMIYFYLLSALEELDLVAMRSWGRSTLGWMYSNTSEILVRQSPYAFVGLCFLWEVCFFLLFVFFY